MDATSYQASYDLSFGTDHVHGVVRRPLVLSDAAVLRRR